MAPDTASGRSSSAKHHRASSNIIITITPLLVDCTPSGCMKDRGCSPIMSVPSTGTLPGAHATTASSSRGGITITATIGEAFSDGDRLSAPSGAAACARLRGVDPRLERDRGIRSSNSKKRTPEQSEIANVFADLVASSKRFSAIVISVRARFVSPRANFNLPGMRVPAYLSHFRRQERPASSLET
jgi:hypothetical protein